MPERSARFTNRTAIITGAGSGLGRATAVRIASEGGTVVCLDVIPEPVEDTAAKIRGVGGPAKSYQVDVADPSSMRAAVEAAARDLGRPAVLVNCVGIGKFANTHEMPFEEWTRIIGVNLTGTFLMAQATLPYLLDGGGNIVTVASNAGLQGVAYCASKGASCSSRRRSPPSTSLGASA